MSVIYENGIYKGLSTEQKPRDRRYINETFQETDTGDIYTTYDGHVWHRIKSLGIVEDSSNSLKADYALLNDKIAGTTTVVTKTGNNISQILHKIGDTSIRQDDYTYPDANTIQETRTFIPTNEQVVITYDLTTLATTVSNITKVVS